MIRSRCPVVSAADRFSDGREDVIERFRLPTMTRKSLKYRGSCARASGVELGSDGFVD